MGRGLTAFVSIDCLIRLVHRSPMNVDDLHDLPGCPRYRKIVAGDEVYHVVLYPFARLFVEFLKSVCDEVLVFAPCASDLLTGFLEGLDVRVAHMSITDNHIAGAPGRRTLAALKKPPSYYDASVIVDTSVAMWHPSLHQQVIICPGLFSTDFGARESHHLSRFSLDVVDRASLQASPFGRKRAPSPLLLAAAQVKELLLMRHACCGAVPVVLCLQQLRANLFYGLRFLIAGGDAAELACMIAAHGGLLVDAAPTHIVVRHEEQLKRVIGPAYRQHLTEEGLGPFAAATQGRRVTAVEKDAVETEASDCDSDSGGTTTTTTTTHTTTPSGESRRTGDTFIADTESGRHSATTSTGGRSDGGGGAVTGNVLLDPDTLTANRTVAVDDGWVRCSCLSLQLFPCSMRILNEYILLQLFAPPPQNPRQIETWMGVDVIKHIWRTWNLQMPTEAAFAKIFLPERQLAAALADESAGKPSVGRFVGMTRRLVVTTCGYKFTCVRLADCDDAARQSNETRHAEAVIEHCLSTRAEAAERQRQREAEETRARTVAATPRRVAHMGSQTPFNMFVCPRCEDMEAAVAASRTEAAVGAAGAAALGRFSSLPSYSEGSSSSGSIGMDAAAAGAGLSALPLSPPTEFNSPPRARRSPTASESSSSSSSSSSPITSVLRDNGDDDDALPAKAARGEAALLPSPQPAVSVAQGRTQTATGTVAASGGGAPHVRHVVSSPMYSFTEEDRRLLRTLEIDEHIVLDPMHRVSLGAHANLLKSNPEFAIYGALLEALLLRIFCFGQ